MSADQSRADALIGGLVDELGPEQAAAALAVLINRAATRLHGLTRAQATARKDQPDWPLWAQLQNASRSLVLQASTCRDLAQRLTGGKSSGTGGTGEGTGTSQSPGTSQETGTGSA